MAQMILVIAMSFLRARDRTACFVDGVVSATLQKFYEEQGFGNFDND